MLSAVAIAFILVEKRRVLMEVVPQSLIKFLDKWEVRMFIILSLVLQILMFMLGNRRKYVCKLWIRIFLWCAYLLADGLAVVSLGNIAKNTLDDCHSDPGDELMWFWAQFFLLHLGGPDTITAYSLEDNELWLRHLVGMVIQTGLASYILLVSFPPSSQWLPYLSLLIFIAGMIKYVERLSTLCAANSENFRDSLLPEPDPGPNYARFMEEYTLKKAEGFDVKVDEVKEIHVPVHRLLPNQPGVCIRDAYDWFLTFKRLFAGAILSFHDRDSSQSYFQKLSVEQAFGVVEIELGFMFDQLYTKASVVYNVRGYIFRVITFSFTLLVWIVFQFLCEKRSYTKLDLAITHLLLGVAVCLEIYAVRALVDSDWTRSRLCKDGDDKTTPFARVIQWFQHPNAKRWSKKMAQHNLLDFCVRDKSGVCPSSQRFLWSIRKLTKIDNYLEKHWHKSFIDVSTHLESLIFEELKIYITHSDQRKGSYTLDKYGSSLKLDWIEEREFDQRILLWHVATDICYSLEWNDGGNTNGERKQISDHCKHISDYMLYLLMVCPFMLPIGIGMIRFRDTCAEARVFLKEREAVITGKAEACNKLLEVNTEVAPGVVKGDRCKSVLFDACRVAKSLMAEEELRWEFLSELWVEMLAHAATHCSGSHHARQLRKGGELLTHVWLLMAHLGITEQFQISRGHARAKLIVK